MVSLAALFCIGTNNWHTAIDNHQSRSYSYSYDERDQLKMAEWGDANKVTDLPSPGIASENAAGPGGGTSEPSLPKYTFSADLTNAYVKSVKGYDKHGNIQVLERR